MLCGAAAVANADALTASTFVFHQPNSTTLDGHVPFSKRWHRSAMPLRSNDRYDQSIHRQICCELPTTHYEEFFVQVQAKNPPCREIIVHNRSQTYPQYVPRVAASGWLLWGR
jgi:hypothetical protein